MPEHVDAFILPWH